MEYFVDLECVTELHELATCTCFHASIHNLPKTVKKFGVPKLIGKNKEGLLTLGFEFISSAKHLHLQF